LRLWWLLQALRKGADLATETRSSAKTPAATLQALRKGADLATLSRQNGSKRMNTELQALRKGADLATPIRRRRQPGVRVQLQALRKGADLATYTRPPCMDSHPRRRSVTSAAQERESCDCRPSKGADLATGIAASCDVERQSSREIFVVTSAAQGR
jgi:hypothetical protein